MKGCFMESINTQAQLQQPPQKKKPWLIVVLVLLLVAAMGAIVVLLTRPPTVVETTPEAGKIGYSTGAVILENDGPFEITPPDEITLEYDGHARSTDGTNFDCFIANAKENTYDMFISIYSDEMLTDELFLSKLFKPGTGFENIRLNRALEKGNHTVYMVLTQVEDDHSAIHNQVVVTMEMIVE